jgi:hypothetical protein
VPDEIARRGMGIATSHWVAVYWGSPTQAVTHDADCGDGDEDVVVATVPRR